MDNAGKDNPNSDDEIQRPALKRKKKPNTITSDTEGEDSEIDVRPKRLFKSLRCDSEDENNNEASSTSSAQRIGNESSHDLSDNEQADRCAICLHKFLGQDIATPETCDHIFCLECIQQWAKNVNTCPIDRLKFNLILIRHHKKEKIIKTIAVKNSAPHYTSESETESIGQADCCVCGGDAYEGPFLHCYECFLFYHYHCILPARNLDLTCSWQCPACNNVIWKAPERLTPSLGSFFSVNRAVRNHSASALQSTSEEVLRLRHRVLYSGTVIRNRIVSDSSEEDSRNNLVPSSAYQSPVLSSASSRTRCPLLRKRRNLCRTRNRALVSATAVSTESAYASDSDDEFRLSSSTIPETFDLVGSILERQTSLHRPDVLTLARDGTLLQTPKTTNTTRSATIPSSTHTSDESAHSSLIDSPPHNNITALPLQKNGVVKQGPLNPSPGNNSSQYRGSSMQAYSCSSTGTPRERTLSYEENNIARPALGANSNDRFGNEPCTPAIQKGFCLSDDMKKEGRTAKGQHSEDEVDIYSDIESVGEEDGVTNDSATVPTKVAFKCDDSQLSNPNDSSDSSDNDLVIDEGQQAEEGHERFKDNAENINQICDSEESNMSSNAGSDQEQLTIDTNPPKPSSPRIEHSSDNCFNDESSHGAFVCDESNNSKLNSGNEDTSKFESDSNNSRQGSDVDMQEDEENSTDITKNSHSDAATLPCFNSSPKSNKISDVDKQDEENSVDIIKEEYQDAAGTPCTSAKSSPKFNNMSDIEMQEDDDSLVNSTEKNYQGYASTPVTSPKSSHPNKMSGMDMQEDEEISLDSSKKSYQGSANIPCTSAKSSPKSCTEEDYFEMQCENSVSNECSQSNLDIYEQGSKEEFEEVTDQENENTGHSDSQCANEGKDDHENSSNLNETEKCKGRTTFDFANEQPNDREQKKLKEISASPKENSDNPELINICNDILMKSDEEDNIDSIENASTPCMDEHIDGQIENSPIQVDYSEEEGINLEKTSILDFEEEKKESENEDKTQPSKSIKNSSKGNKKSRSQDGCLDLNVEDVSDAGSEEICTVLNEEEALLPATVEEDIDDVERKVASLFSPERPEEDDCLIISKRDSDEFKKCPSPNTSQSFEDQEEGEIIEERPVHRCKKKKNRMRDENIGDYGEYAPRVNISDLPRIPKLKRDRDKDNAPETIAFDSKRTSVLSRVDLGEDISWKRLSKHTRERSYRDGRPKDESLLFRERESRKKSKKSNGASRRNESKNSDKHRDEKKNENEKSKGDHDSRSRKSEKNKSVDYNYSERDKRKSHKDRHSSRDKHSKDNKREKDKYDKKHSKDEDRYERDLRYEKEERLERTVYEKSKFKEREHKSKHRDRKSDSSKTCKEHSRDKHKHSHSRDRLSDKQREVRKVDDKIKIVVEQKESRKDKSKHKERKEIKLDTRPIFQRKVERPERSPYKEITSIESKEIFAKGDSIIINVNFNRAVSPKITTPTESDTKEKKVVSEDKELTEQFTSTDVKSKSKICIDKSKTIDNTVGKRSITPTGKNTSVLSVSESYWQGGDDPDGNNSPSSEKSIEIIFDDAEVEANGSGETNSCSSADTLTTPTEVKNCTLMSEKSSVTPKSESSDNILKEKVKENEGFSSKRRSPRSPSPPSPADNDSYDPCEPTQSPSPPPVPPSPPLPTTNPKPPPSPELPPLPPEPEPSEESHKPKPPDFSGSSSTIASKSQANTVQTQTSTASPMQGLLMPPSFLARVSAATSNLQGLSPHTPSRNGSFPVNNHGGVMLPPNQMQQMMGANFMSHMHGANTLQPPPNPPNMPHMTSVPPPPPPPTGMTLLPPARHPRLNVQPPITPNSLLQSLTMVHNVNTPPMQLIHHLPPNLSGILSNHQPSVGQNPPSSLPSSIANQQVMRMVFSQNQMPNRGNALLPTPTTNNRIKPQGGNLAQAGSLQQKSEKHSKRSPSAEKNEVIDMDVGTPYSPGDSPPPSGESGADYSPACSPEPASSPKNKDVFDTLFAPSQRTSEKRTCDVLTSNEKPKAHSSSKKSKHDHKRHPVRLQVKEKHKKTRKEQKQADEAQLKILDELPSSAVEMQVKEKFLKKLNRQERVVEEVKTVLKPYYKSRDVTKEEYKDILRKSVPKICHNRSGDINPVKVRSLVESYVRKAKLTRKKGDKRKSKFS
ncbi:hypothetical protein JTE90_016908 [Oedothorax gibbosus]|uniref:RING-type domain-containing protein n=1 Tax=Oedothorax gibbosus TaxID=931172 RepID=A0AAV6UUN4_9ARAC|nr:hypothetical protein JTE90_016908 [Oedothorax gibbosus]